MFFDMTLLLDTRASAAGKIRRHARRNDYRETAASSGDSLASVDDGYLGQFLCNFFSRLPDRQSVKVQNSVFGCRHKKAKLEWPDGAQRVGG
jgi:hypothetical protein